MAKSHAGDRSGGIRNGRNLLWYRVDQNERRRKDRQLAAVLMLIEITLLLDIAFNWRWMLHAFVVDVARGGTNMGFARTHS